MPAGRLQGVLLPLPTAEMCHHPLYSLQRLTVLYLWLYHFQKSSRTDDLRILGEVLQVPGYQNSATVLCDLVKLFVSLIGKRTVHGFWNNREPIIVKPAQQSVDLALGKTKLGPPQHSTVLAHNAAIHAGNHPSIEHQAQHLGGGSVPGPTTPTPKCSCQSPPACSFLPTGRRYFSFNLFFTHISFGSCLRAHGVKGNHSLGLTDCF